MLRKSLDKLLFISAILMLLTSCGGGGSSNSNQTSNVYSGIAQKGPFSIGSKIDITALDSNGNEISEPIKTDVDDLNGQFSFNIVNTESNNFYRMVVSGTTFDENKGTYSEYPISLSTITNDPNASSINVLTHWLANRIDVLLVEGKQISTAFNRSRNELSQLFGIENVNSLDITTRSTLLEEEDAMLLLLSGALMEASTRYQINPQIIIDEIANDFADDGKLSKKGDEWFIRIQSIIKDNPASYVRKYAKQLKDNFGFIIQAEQNLPETIPLASRPTANVPPEILAEPGDTITLDGSASHDSGDIINFTWFRVDQQIQYDIQVSDRFSDTPSITVPDEATVLAAPNQEISLLYALVVTDVDKLTHTGVVKVTVKIPPPENNPPVANSQLLITDEDTPIAITLSADDVDGDSINYIISTPLTTPNGLVELDPNFNSTLPNLFYIPTQDFFGNDSFSFLVNDGFANSNIATVDIQVNPINDPPIADANIDQVVESAELVTLNGSGTDIDGTVDAYLWQQQLGGTIVSLNDATLQNPSFTTPTVPSVAETLSFDLVVTDNEGADSVADTVNIVVNPINQPPEADAGADQNVISGETVTLLGSGTDSDGTVDAYLWSQNGGTLVSLSDPSEPSPTFTAPNVLNTAETLTFDLIVTDDDGENSTIDSVDVVVSPPANLPPVANAGQNQTVFVAEAVTLSGSGTDSDGTVVSYLWSQSGGTTVSLSSNTDTSPTFTAPTVLSTPETLTFDLIVTDDDGENSTIDSVDIIVNPPINNRPVANAGADQNILSTRINLGAGFLESTPIINLDGSGSSDAEDATSDLSFTWTQISGPISIDPNDLISPSININGILNQDIDGTYVFRLVVTDLGGLVSDPDQVNIVVSPAPINLPPTADNITLPIDLFASTGTFITLIGNDPDGNNANLDYEILTDPLFGDITPSVGVILGNGNNTEYQSFSVPSDDSFEYRVIDEQGAVSNTAIVTLTAPNNRPTANSFSVAINQGFDVSIPEGPGEIEGFDLDGDPITIVDVTDPSNGTLVLDSTGGNNVYTYTPATNFFGEDSFTYKVNDGTEDSVVATVTINVNARPIANAGFDRTVTQNDDVTLFGSSSRDPDGTISLYEWSQNSSDADQVSLSNANTERPSFTAPAVATGGPNKVLNFDLFITDNNNFRSFVDSVRITVTEVCQPIPPTATAGVDRNVVSGTDVTLYGSAIVGDNCDPSYEGFPFVTWSQLNVPPDPDVGLPIPGPFGGDPSPTFTAPAVNDITELRFQLIAVDDLTGVTSDPVIMTVTVHPDSSTLPPNLPPTATSNSDDYNLEVLGNGDTLFINLRADDPDGDNQGLTYRVISTTTNGDLNIGFAPDGSSYRYVPNYPVATNDSFVFIATDQDGADSSPITVNISRIVEPVGNNAPIANGGTFTGRSIDTRLTIPIDDFVSETDVDDFYRLIEVNRIENNLIFEEPIDNFFTGFSMRVNHLVTPDPANGEYEFVAVDKYGRASSPTKFIVIFNGPNPPTANAGPDRTVGPGEFLTLFGSGTDIDGTISQFGDGWTQTAGTTVSTSGSATPNLFFNAPNITNGTEVLVFEYIVEDDEGYPSAPDEVRVTVDASVIPNNRPTANDFSFEVNQGSSVVIPQGPSGLGGTDLDGDTLTLIVPEFSLSRRGVISVENTGSGDVYTYTPDPERCGDHFIDYTVSDGQVISRSVRVTVNVNCRPVADDLGDFTIISSGASIVLSGTDEEGPIASYEIISPPTNGSFDNGTTLPTLLYLPDNPSAPLSDQFSFRVIDNQGFQSEPQIVNLFAGNSVPSTTSGDLVIPAGVDEVDFDLNDFANDLDGDTLTFEIVGTISGFFFDLSNSFSSDGIVTGKRRFGTPSFQFRVIDQNGAKSNIATMQLISN